jgi:hypothetical protein
MKKIFYLLSLLFLFSSCLPDNDDYPNYHLELVPIENVILPESFVTGQTYNITVQYLKKSSCHYPDGIYYESDLNTRIIAVQNIVHDKSDCSNNIPEDQIIQEMTFDFKVLQQSGSSYVFKFYKGMDEDNNRNFLLVEVPVLDYQSYP